MVLYKKMIRPVGNHIQLKSNLFHQEQLSPYKARFFQSGTAALAAAIIAVIKHSSVESDEPEVLIPAYGCPDLVSAIVFAGAKPVMVDLEPNLPWMSVDLINTNINKNTIAIIAVGFLGISERLDELSTICKKHNLILIEDSAQGFPISDTSSYWKGDYVVISFGRGKPVNLLRGGAVLSKDVGLLDLLPTPRAANNNIFNLVKYVILLSLYNISINSTAYGVISKLPGLNLGKTFFKPLQELTAIQKHVLDLLNNNIIAYKKSHNISNNIMTMLREFDSNLVDDVVMHTGHDLNKPLLRYPILINKSFSRDDVFIKLKPLGASVMYQQPLHMIDGVREILKKTIHEFPNATEFSSRLITLATHQDITTSVINKIYHNLNKSLSN